MRRSKLREIRKHAGISMKEVASYAGVSEASISRIERGQQQPSPELACRISEYFRGQINPIELMGFDEATVQSFLTTKASKRIAEKKRFLEENVWFITGV